jgi:hypothetical protein
MWSLEEVVSFLDHRGGRRIEGGMQSGQVLGGVAGVVIAVWYVAYRVAFVRNLWRSARSGRAPFSGDRNFDRRVS